MNTIPSPSLNPPGPHCDRLPAPVDSRPPRHAERCGTVRLIGVPRSGNRHRPQPLSHLPIIDPLFIALEDAGEIAVMSVLVTCLVSLSFPRDSAPMGVR
jgi:hypothetical protein